MLWEDYDEDDDEDGMFFFAGIIAKIGIVALLLSVASCGAWSVVKGIENRGAMKTREHIREGIEQKNEIIRQKEKQDYADLQEINLLLTDKVVEKEREMPDNKAINIDEEGLTPCGLCLYSPP